MYRIRHHSTLWWHGVWDTQCCVLGASEGQWHSKSQITLYIVFISSHITILLTWYCVNMHSQRTHRWMSAQTSPIPWSDAYVSLTRSKLPNFIKNLKLRSHNQVELRVLSWSKSSGSMIPKPKQRGKETLNVGRWPIGQTCPRPMVDHPLASPMTHWAWNGWKTGSSLGLVCQKAR